MPGTPLPAGVLLSAEPRAGGDGGRGGDGCTSGRTSRSGSTVELRDVLFFAIATETDRSICHNSECRRRVDVQCVTTQLEPSVSKNPRDGKVKWGQDRTWSWARAVAAGLQPRRAAKRTHLTKNGRRCSFAEFCNSSQRAHPSSLRKEKRPRWQKSFALGGLRQVAACSTCFLRLFSTFGTGWNLNGPARLAKCWTTLEERMVVIGS